MRLRLFPFCCTAIGARWHGVYAWCVCEARYAGETRCHLPRGVPRSSFCLFRIFCMDPIQRNVRKSAEKGRMHVAKQYTDRQRQADRRQHARLLGYPWSRANRSILIMYAITCTGGAGGSTCKTATCGSAKRRCGARTTHARAHTHTHTITYIHTHTHAYDGGFEAAH
jgi:hypothetical protein